MSVEVLSSTLKGFEAQPVRVECNLSNNLPIISIVGMASKAVEESKERIRSAITNSSLLIPRKKITINLAPADIPKNGSSLDLPIAIAILLASKQILVEKVKNCIFVGELSLDGQIRGIDGILGHIASAKQHKFNKIVIPSANITQARLVEGIEVIAVNSLFQLYKHLSGELILQPMSTIHPDICTSRNEITMSDINGQKLAKRAMKIAIAGRHNILLTGPPGTGKTLLARAAQSIMPPLQKEQIHDLTHLYSLTDNRQKIISCRPFRMPHHTTSNIALVGGGRIPKPGEVSLAHHGILFLDELLEFSRYALETLRQPLESGIVHIVRTDSSASFPADFTLIGALNPCPCGYLGDDRRTCLCSTSSIQNYQKRLSGPLLDRFDIQTYVPRIKLGSTDEDKADIEDPKQQIQAAWRIQHDRNSGSVMNSKLDFKAIESITISNPDLKRFYRETADKLALSTRGYVKTLRVARTIADFEGQTVVNKEHLLEAIAYHRRSTELT